MQLAISCLGFAIYTQHNLESWDGFQELKRAEKYASLLTDSLRSIISNRMFIHALRCREKDRVHTKEIQFVHGRDWYKYFLRKGMKIGDF